MRLLTLDHAHRTRLPHHAFQKYFLFSCAIIIGDFMSYRLRRALIPILFGFLLLSSTLLTSIPVTKAAGTIVISEATAQELAPKWSGGSASEPT
jgi:hypothetical protein